MSNGEYIIWYRGNVKAYGNVFYLEHKLQYALYAFGHNFLRTKTCFYKEGNNLFNKFVQGDYVLHFCNEFAIVKVNQYCSNYSTSRVWWQVYSWRPFTGSHRSRPRESAGPEVRCSQGHSHHVSSGGWPRQRPLCDGLLCVPWNHIFWR